MGVWSVSDSDGSDGGEVVSAHLLVHLPYGDWRSIWRRECNVGEGVWHNTMCVLCVCWISLLTILRWLV